MSEQGLLLRLMNDLFAESPACRAHERILLVQFREALPYTIGSVFVSGVARAPHVRMADLQSQGSEVHCKVQMLEARLLWRGSYGQDAPVCALSTFESAGSGFF